MPDYRKMYFTLFNCLCDAVKRKAANYQKNNLFDGLLLF